MRADQHAASLRYPMARPRPHGSEPDRLPPHRRRAHVPLQLALRAPAGRRVPPADREHRHEPRGRRRGRPDPGVADAGSGSTGTARRRSSSTGWSDCAASPSRLVAEGKAYEDDGAIRFRMPDEGVDGLGRRRRGPDRVSRTRSSRISSSSARTAGRPTTSLADGGRAGTGSRTSSAATTTSRTRRSRSRSSARSAPSCPSTRTCRTSSGRTAKKLSKRHGAPAVDEFRAAGYLARGAAQLPRAARLELRRQDDAHVPRGARRAVLARARRLEPGARSTTRSSTG